MTRGLAFWILVLIWVIFGFLGYSDALQAKHMIYVGYGSNLLLLALFGLVGWQIFGAPIQGGPPKA